ncbi:sensor histidine kinase [Oryzibacter oryziterrae]|uniref:sensor histidine kinase n=1 Tax=Oryzibacter oryziterrae TaxID=2766474 RepID=UPI001F3D91AB|nr:ATP-binding protein [Oryzibacter oryziterrae]
MSEASLSEPLTVARTPRRWWRGACLALAAMATAVGVGWVTYTVGFNAAVDGIRGNAVHRLDLYGASIEREINKFADYPYVMGFDATVRALLIDPENDHLKDLVNTYFQKLNSRIGTLDVYLLNRDGRVIASSNFDQPTSFVGRDLSYRPYYRNARVDRVERFFGIGTTDKLPGYFLATALHEGANVLGVGVVKVSLDQLEKSWASVESPAILSDEHGVVMLSSVPGWKFGALAPLSPEARRQIVAAQQFNDRDLAPIGVTVLKRLDGQTQIVRLPEGQTDSAFSTGGLYLAESRAMAETPWQLTVYTNLGEANDMAGLQAALGGLATLAVFGLWATWRQQRRHRREQIAAQIALQQAHDNLEGLVAERTSELSQSNERLKLEVGERLRAEATLREAQTGLVQAGKLAVIGQLSAGIAHELNQPLAALGTLAGNAVKFLERGDTATVQTNLQRIQPLVDRMGRLTGELKTFARKSSGEPQRAELPRMLDDALFLISHRIARGPVSVERDIPARLPAVRCDPNRMEQVLLNVIGNALDAMEGQTRQVLSLTARAEGDRLLFEVADSGPGIADDKIDAIFEPFYTTKAPGVGLGLGLAISAGILRDIGGQLTARNAAGGGAVFTMVLPIWNGES